MRNVLVTGGAGFIGSNLVRLLLDRADRVTVLDNLSSGYSENLDPFPGVRFVKGDVRDEAAVEEAIDGASAVFHLAASVGNVRSIEFPILDSDINVLGTLKLLEASRRHGVRKFVFSSSAGIFGELKTLPIQEDHPVEPDSPYGASKLGAEKLCLVYAKLHPISCVCLRYFNVYGPNQRYDAYGNVIPMFCERILRNEPLTIYGDGRQTRDFVNVRDVAEANYLASGESTASGAYNIGSGTSVTILELVDLLRAVSDRSLTVQHVAPRRGEVLHSRADIGLAARTFGFAPRVPFREGLAEYWAWKKRAS